MVKIKRAYDAVSPADGKRILIDRLWPRGIKKEEFRIDEWLKDLAPSDGLRRWFAHDPSKWGEFKKRYHQELKEKEPLVDALRQQAERETVTLIFSAKNPDFNNAVALRELVSR